jgi:hypothetical protein
VVGEPNRPSTVRDKKSTGSSTIEKTGDIAADDTQELMSLISTLRGFPSHDSTDVYGHNVILEFATFEIQWSNKDDDTSADVVSEIAGEQKDDFKRVADSIEALARQFAKKDAAV